MATPKAAVAQRQLWQAEQHTNREGSDPEKHSNDADPLPTDEPA